MGWAMLLMGLANAYAANQKAKKEADVAEKNNRQAAVTNKYSGWTGKNASYTEMPDILSNTIQGGVAGAGYGAMLSDALNPAPKADTTSAVVNKLMASEYGGNQAPGSLLGVDPGGLANPTYMGGEYAGVKQLPADIWNKLRTGAFDPYAKTGPQRGQY